MLQIDITSMLLAFVKGVSASASTEWIFASLYQSGYTVSVSHIETVKNTMLFAFILRKCSGNQVMCGIFFVVLVFN